MAEINFFSEEIDFVLKQKSVSRAWLSAAAKSEGFRIGDLNFIFCTDDYLLAINREYLQHDTYTDIITFDNSESEDTLAGDIFISIDRIRDNAKRFGVPEWDELHRVMIHGVLHLCGYDDHEPEDKQLMTEKEDFYLAVRGAELLKANPR